MVTWFDFSPSVTYSSSKNCSSISLILSINWISFLSCLWLPSTNLRLHHCGHHFNFLDHTLWTFFFSIKVIWTLPTWTPILKEIMSIETILVPAHSFYVTLNIETVIPISLSFQAAYSCSFKLWNAWLFLLPPSLFFTPWVAIKMRYGVVLPE